MAQNKTSHDDATTSTAVRYAEKIVLLEMISQLPGQPPDAGPQSLPRKLHEEDDNRRTLSLRHENEVASTLAFLSGISNSPNHITAVCLEEMPAERGCKVLLAINKLGPDGGQHVLEKIKRGFEQVFGRLSKISSGVFHQAYYQVQRASPREDRNKMKEAVFNDVVALCRDRILSRLRVKAWQINAYKKEGRFIGDNLEEFLKFPWRTAVVRHDLTAAHLRRYRCLAQALLGHLSNFNAAKDYKHETVVKLVYYIAEFMEEVPFKDVVDSVEDHPMEESAKFRLHNCLSKIARYRQSALLLSRLTKKIPILRRVTVDHVCLVPAAFQRPSRTLGPSNLDTVLKAIPNRRGFLKFSSLPCWTKKSQQQFTANVEKALRESKIHAEIQIVAHYETANPGVVGPRVIASSKDACYLCHALIRLHGKYSVPKSHGKLYTGWRLPATQDFEALGRNLQNFLDREILTNTIRFAQHRNKPPVTLPNESTLYPLNISASTLLSCLDLPSQTRYDHVIIQRTPEALDDHMIAKTDEYQQTYDHYHPPSSSALHGIKSSINGAVSACPEVQCCSKAGGDKVDDEVSRYADQAKQHAEATASTTINPIERLADADSGISSTNSIITKSPGRACTLPEPICFRKGRFCHENKEIFIEDPSSSTKLRWLSPADSAEILREKAGAVVDVLLLAAGIDTQCLPKGPESVSYFSFGQQVVMIETSFL